MMQFYYIQSKMTILHGFARTYPHRKMMVVVNAQLDWVTQN